MNSEMEASTSKASASMFAVPETVLSPMPPKPFLPGDKPQTEGRSYHVLTSGGGSPPEDSEFHILYSSGKRANQPETSDYHFVASGCPWGAAGKAEGRNLLRSRNHDALVVGARAARSLAEDAKCRRTVKVEDGVKPYHAWEGGSPGRNGHPRTLPRVKRSEIS